MNWLQLLEALEQGKFFRALGSFENPEELASCLLWVPLFKTESIWQWLGQDGWAKSALGHNNPIVKPVLSLLLKRHLLDLNTRFQPAGLLAYWDWVMQAMEGTGKVASVWESEAEALRSTCTSGELSLGDIITQEEGFVETLRRAHSVLLDSPPSLDWAQRTLRRLLARCEGPAAKEGVKYAVSRVVLAWEGAIPSDLRRAILVDLELKDQGNGGAGTRLRPERLFDSRFHETVDYVAERIGSRFHRLEFQPFWEPIRLHARGEMGVELPNGKLAGESGGLAIWLAQVLANWPADRRRKTWYVLPPWVVVTAALDRQANGVVSSVGAIGAKVRLLREEGVRVVVVADNSAQLTEARHALQDRPGVRIHEYISGPPERFAKTLIDNRCAWAADIGRWKQPVLTRRRFLAATATSLVVGTAAGGYLFRHRHPETLAMQQHRGKLELMWQTEAEVKQYFAQHPDAWDSYFRDILGATEVKQVPADTSFRGLRILHDSKFFDSTNWKKVQLKKDIFRTPIEPAYFTRVLRLQKLDTAPQTIVIEFNTGGFGVIPIKDPSRGTDRIYYSQKPMRESKAPGQSTRTTYLVTDISRLGTEGQPFDLVFNAVWFNGAQDQVHRGADHDWWGTRLHPGTRNADLAVALPTSKAFGSVMHVLRKEDNIFEEVGEDHQLWSPASYRTDATYTEGPVSVWVLDCEKEERRFRQEVLRSATATVGQGKELQTLVLLRATLRDFRWIYSIQWTWKQ